MLNKQGIIRQLADGHLCSLRVEAPEKVRMIPGVDAEKIRTQQAAGS